MTNILLVEDEPHQGLMLKEELEDAGYGVNLVDNGHAAVKQLQEGERPDLVVLDIAMPGMDGIETLGKLLAEDNQLPVILHTAYAQYKNNFMSWAADAYVIKSPSDLQGLKDEIERVLAERGRGQDDTETD
jgi:CheY-like chemotaxis protein